MPNTPNGWEPDPHQVGTNWQSMFDTRRANQGAEQPPPPTPMPEEVSENDIRVDLTEYKPWHVQRVRSRLAVMLDLRRYEPRSGLRQSWAMPYHNLYAIETLGDHMLSLDFGVRQFVIEGASLDSLTRHLQEGAVLKIVEYSPSIWPTRNDGPLVTAIRRITGASQAG